MRTAVSLYSGVCVIASRCGPIRRFRNTSGVWNVANSSPSRTRSLIDQVLVEDRVRDRVEQGEVGAGARPEVNVGDRRELGAPRIDRDQVRTPARRLADPRADDRVAEFEGGERPERPGMTDPSDVTREIRETIASARSDLSEINRMLDRMPTHADLWRMTAVSLLVALGIAAVAWWFA